MDVQDAARLADVTNSLTFSLRNVERLILATPTGELRDKLTELQIHLIMAGNSAVETARLALAPSA